MWLLQFGVTRAALVAALAAIWGPIGVRSQFGGPNAYNPPPPKCPLFKCKKGEKAAGIGDYQLWSYGCKDSGMSFLNTASFDPNNPLKGMQQKSVDKCCVERDICKQTCGMSAKACHDNFQKCSKKICRGDQNCEMQAMLSELMSEPYDPDEKFDSKKYDPEETKCRGYNKGQKESCQCVPEDDWQAVTDSNLKSFYTKYNPEKVDENGEIKGLDEVWKKWKGKESEMFMGLGIKYKEKAVEIRQKPKPPPYTPPDKAAETPAEEEEVFSAPEPDASSSSAPERSEPEDPAGELFIEKTNELEAKKKKATADEDYDMAQEIKDEIISLSRKEKERLESLKKQAIADEDYLAAKALKKKIEKFSEL
jgi:hypothetical protein